MLQVSVSVSPILATALPTQYNLLANTVPTCQPIVMFIKILHKMFSNDMSCCCFDQILSRYLRQKV